VILYFSFVLTFRRNFVEFRMDSYQASPDDCRPDSNC